MARWRDHSRRRGASAGLSTLLLAVVLSGADIDSAHAQVPDGQPPAPGALARELGLPPLSRDDAVPTVSGPHLSGPIEIPFILEGGHIIVEASINGSSPKPFMFDTGASNLITPETRPDNAQATRVARLGGVGPQVSQAEIVTLERITIGAALLDHPTVAVIDLPNTIVDRGSRPRLAGMIGAQLLSRYAVTIDYGRHTLTLNNPGFRPKTAAFALPLGFSLSPDGLTHPSISAELDGVAGDFILDTGSGTQIFVSDAFQLEHAPFGRYGKVLSLLGPGGIGGRTRVQIAFGKQLRIGQFALSPPVVTGAEKGGGRLGQKHTAGLIGFPVLAQFVVTIDYQAGRAYFEPVPGRKLPAVLHGTGMSYDKPDHGAFEVLDILPGSAAERAGLRRGDRIVEVNGQPARDLSTSDVQSLSAAPAHTSLTVRTADSRRLTLAIGQILP